ncbi:hypothetical protein Bca4012_011364 [Brassica carinata]
MRKFLYTYSIKLQDNLFSIVGGGLFGLVVAQQVYEARLFICSFDPSPKLIWPNNYGVWVDEFEAIYADSIVVCSVQVDIDYVVHVDIII